MSFNQMNLEKAPYSSDVTYILDYYNDLGKKPITGDIKTSI